MDIQTVINKRLLEQAQQRLDQKRKARIEQLMTSARESYAQAAISEWIEQIYGVSFDPDQLAVVEKRLLNDGQGYYSLRINLDNGSMIRCNRDMIVAFPDGKADIEHYADDTPGSNRFGSAWVGRRNDYGQTDTFHDLVDAAIFATGATLTTSEADVALFVEEPAAS